MRESVPQEVRRSQPPPHTEYKLVNLDCCKYLSVAHGTHVHTDLPRAACAPIILPHNFIVHLTHLIILRTRQVILVWPPHTALFVRRASTWRVVGSKDQEASEVPPSFPQPTYCLPQTAPSLPRLLQPSQVPKQPEIGYCCQTCQTGLPPIPPRRFHLGPSWRLRVHARCLLSPPLAPFGTLSLTGGFVVYAHSGFQPFQVPGRLERHRTT